MMEISRTLKDSRKVEGRVTNDHTLDELLIQSYWLNNLDEAKIQRLKQASFSEEEIIIIDYLSGFSQEEIVNNFGREEDKLKYLSGVYLSSKNERVESREQYPLTPQKLMAGEVFFSLLKNDIAKGIIGEAISREECKEVLFLDYLVRALSPRRKSKLMESMKIKEKLKKSAVLYVMQKGSERISELNSGLEGFLSSLKSNTEISVRDITRYRDLSVNSPPDIDSGLDEESAELLAK
ncbi:MAG: hypothetical protein Q7S74_02615, partial [Nanoarchaeota archaeon]|nr:hypothetical protein [Nanoarchaeota archaeon]